MPDIKTVTIYFLKGLIDGSKKCKFPVSDLSHPVVSFDSVVHVHAPCYENLKLAEIYKYFEKSPDILRYLPDGQELRKAPRQWIVNVAASILGKPFQDWVGAKIKERNATVTEERNMLINMDPRVAAAFHASNAVSCKYAFEFSEFNYLARIC